MNELDMTVQCKQEGTAVVRTGKSICSFSWRMERLLELGNWMPLKGGFRNKNSQKQIRKLQ